MLVRDWMEALRWPHRRRVLTDEEFAKGNRAWAAVQGSVADPEPADAARDPAREWRFDSGDEQAIARLRSTIASTAETLARVTEPAAFAAQVEGGYPDLERSHGPRAALVLAALRTSEGRYEEARALVPEDDWVTRDDFLAWIDFRSSR